MASDTTSNVIGSQCLKLHLCQSSRQELLRFWFRELLELLQLFSPNLTCIIFWIFISSHLWRRRSKADKEKREKKTTHHFFLNIFSLLWKYKRDDPPPKFTLCLLSLLWKYKIRRRPITGQIVFSVQWDPLHKPLAQFRWLRHLVGWFPGQITSSFRNT